MYMYSILYTVYCVFPRVASFVDALTNVRVASFGNDTTEISLMFDQQVQ